MGQALQHTAHELRSNALTLVKGQDFQQGDAGGDNAVRDGRDVAYDWARVRIHCQDDFIPVLEDAEVGFGRWRVGPAREEALELGGGDVILAGGIMDHSQTSSISLSKR